MVEEGQQAVFDPKMVATIATLNNNFTYHPPKEGQQEKYVRLREEVKELALSFIELVPESRERSLAMTKLEESVMWANAGIARNE